MLLIAIASQAAVGKLIPAPNRWDMVYDEVRDIVYITQGTQILRYRIATDSFLTPYEVPDGSLAGIDLSPDRNTLIVCDTNHDDDHTWVRRVDVPTDTITRVDFPRAWNEGGTWAVAFTNDGAALVSSRYKGSGWVPLRRYVPATGAVANIFSVCQDSMVCASADGSSVGIAESNCSGGPLDRYRASDGDCRHVADTDAYNYEIGVSRDGSQWAVPTYRGAYVYDQSFNVIATVGTYAGPQPNAAVYHPTRDIVYFPFTGTTTIRAYRTTDLTWLGSYDFGHGFGITSNHAFAQGRTRIARDGSYLFCTVSGGVRYAPATLPTPPTSLVVDSSHPEPGQDVTATAGGGWDPLEGALSYEYDWSKVSSLPLTAPAARPGAAAKRPLAAAAAAVVRVVSKAWGDHSGPVLPGSATTLGDRWQVRARCVTAAGASEWLTGPAVCIGNVPPSVPTSLTITPATPVCTSTLDANAGGSSDYEGVTPTYQYQWSQWEGSAWGAWGHTSTDGTLTGVTLHRGERWRVQARAFDGVNYSTFGAPAETTIANTGPTTPTTLTISPDSPDCNAALRATAGGSNDVDNDALTYRYQWSRCIGSTWMSWGYACADGVLTETVRKGQRWRVQAQAFDGVAYSSFTPVPVQVDIGNAPPPAPAVRITPAVPLPVSSLVAHGVSYDPDSDPVTYLYEWSEFSDGAWGAWGHQSSDGVLTGVTLQDGSRWRAHAQASDGTAVSAWGEPFEVTVTDVPCTVPTSLTIAPAQPLCTNTLLATAGGSTDPGGGTVGYKYEWSCRSEGGPAAARGRSKADWGPWGYPSTDGVLTGAVLRKGDAWRVHACATGIASDSAWTDPVEVTIGNTPPTASVVGVTPTAPTRDSALGAQATATDADGDGLTYTYQWSLWTQGAWGAWGYDSTDGVLDLAPLKKGDRWRARAKANDGVADGAWGESGTVIIGNSAPYEPTRSRILPSRPTTHMDLVAQAQAADPDGDNVAYRFQWSTSSDEGLTWSEWAAGDRIVAAGETERGEQWRMRCRAFDGTDYGPWLQSPVVVIVNCVPRPPTSVVITPTAPKDNAPLFANASGAGDADGDVLEYAYQWARSRDGGEHWSAWSWRGNPLAAWRTVPGELWRARCRVYDGIDYSGWKTSGPVTIESGFATSLKVAAAVAPTRTGAHLQLSLTAPAEVTVTIRNLAGRLVAVLQPGLLPAGARTLLWQGQSASGTTAPPGAYTVEITARGRDGATCSAISSLRR